jgi:hypothetical protein
MSEINFQRDIHRISKGDPPYSKGVNQNVEMQKKMKMMKKEMNKQTKKFTQQTNFQFTFQMKNFKRINTNLKQKHSRKH